MNRRGFFGRLFGAALAPLAAELLPKKSEELGISIRYIRNVDPVQGLMISRMSVIYGYQREWSAIQSARMEDLEFLNGTAWVPRRTMRTKFDPARLPA